MPDRESAITRQSTKHEPTIRRNSWKRNAFSIRTSIKQRIHLRTERSGFRVERDAAQAISQFSNGIRHQASRSSAIKQTLTIRRKRGKRIKTWLRSESGHRQKRMALHIVNDHIRCRVINLRPLSGMQLLGRPIDGKSDVTTRRMPIRIGKSWYRLICFRIQ